MRFLFRVFVTVFLIQLLDYFNVNAQNIALHKSYTVSSKPNYSLSASPTDRKSLTDGVYTTERTFWTQRTTVGWQDKEFLEIVIDLNYAQPIGVVKISTIKGEGAGVYYPKDIFIYLSMDGEHYYQVGQAIVSKKGAERKHAIFSLDKIGFQAQYVAICIKPRGRFFFTDEVEVLKGDVSNELEGSAISKSILRRQVDSLSYLKDKKRKETQFALKIYETYSDPLRQPKYSIGINSKKAFEKKASWLKKKFNSSFIVEKTSPWIKTPFPYQPKKEKRELDYKFYALKGNTLYGAFILTNTEQTKIKYSFSFQNPRLCNAQLFRVISVRDINGKFVPDALTSIEKEDSLNAGQSRLYIYRLKNIKHKGNIQLRIKNKKQKRLLNIEVLLFSTKLEPPALYANNWAYFDSPMLKDIKKRAIEDLKNHHINVYVIPPSILPNLMSNNFDKFKRYISLLPRNSKILLFLNYKYKFYRLGYNNLSFLSSEWKNKFIEWYRHIIKITKSLDFPSSNIVLYPYDEVTRKEDIKDFKLWISWVKEEFPRVKIYATISNREAAEELYHYLDILQVPIYSKLPMMFKDKKTKIWGYTTSSSSRNLSPYKYYRLMSWRAYMKGLKGIGFWNYAGNKKKTYLGTPLYSKKQDFAVIYNDKHNDLISSRRWEAFKLGLEDYEVIVLYAKKVGKAQARRLVYKVLVNSKDVDLADKIRIKMIKTIFDKP